MKVIYVKGLRPTAPMIDALKVACEVNSDQTTHTQLIVSVGGSPLVFEEVTGFEFVDNGIAFYCRLPHEVTS